jgi:hypothetical protein
MALSQQLRDTNSNMENLCQQINTLQAHAYEAEQQCDLTQLKLDTGSFTWSATSLEQLSI